MCFIQRKPFLKKATVLRNNILEQIFDILENSVTGTPLRRQSATTTVIPASFPRGRAVKVDDAE